MSFAGAPCVKASKGVAGLMHPARLRASAVCFSLSSSSLHDAAVAGNAERYAGQCIPLFSTGVASSLLTMRSTLYPADNAVSSSVPLVFRVSASARSDGIMELWGVYSR